MSDTISPRALDPEGVPDGSYVLTVSGGHITGLSASSASGGSGTTFGPENLQYDTVDVAAYAGQSDAGLRLALADVSHVGSDEATHPSVLHFPEGKFGYRYWMAFTPYPGSSNAAEDPNVAASQDGTTWETPAGFTNPLDDQGGGTTYNSDTELAVSTDGLTLYCIWRTVTSTQEILYLRSTTDGVTWTAKTAILTVTKTAENIVSPAILHDGTQWVMWTIDAVPTPNVIRRRTATSLTGPWSAATACTLSGTQTGREAWHLSVIKLGAQYVGLLTDSPTGGGTIDNRLYLMRSTDQLAWTLSPNQATAQTLAGNYDALYRGSLVPTFENGRLELDMWYGAWTNAATDVWGIYRRRLSKGGTGSSGITVQDENGTVATGVTQLDFQGANVTAAAGTGEVVVTFTGSTSSASGGEVLMQDGVSSPPVPLESEDGTDWLYEG